MKRSILRPILHSILGLCLLSTGLATGQTTWNFGTTSPGSAEPIANGANVSGGAVSQGNNNGTTTMLSTTSASSGYTGASGQFNAGAAARTGALNTGANGSAYFEFTLTPQPGATITVTSIAFGSRSTSTGPQAYTIRSDADNYATDLATGTLSNTGTWALSTSSGLSVEFAIPRTFRIYGHNGTGSPGANTANWRIDDLAVTSSSVGGSDTTPPSVISRIPAVAATNVGINTTVSISFNEPVQLGTGAIELYREDGVTDVLVPIGTVNVAGNTVSFAPTTALIPGATYYVLIASGAITDIATVPNAFAGITDPTAWTFTTDGTAPTVSTLSPTNAQTNVATGANLVATFSEPIVAGTGDVVIRLASDNSALFTIPIADPQITITGSTLTINPSTNLPSGAAVYVEVAATALTDTSTNAFAGISGSATWAFTTDGTAPSIVSFSPTNGATLASVGANLVATFDEPVRVGTGDVVVRRVSDGSALFTIPVTDPQVSISGPTLTINPTSDLPFLTAVYVEIPATAVTDTSSNAFAGISGSSTWSFSTYPSPTVVINKIANTSGDRVELLVVGNQVPGSTVDMRGMILKDFSSNGTEDNGGRITFANTTFWSAIPVGTLIVLQASTTASPDTDVSDFVLSLGLSNTTYFTPSATFDISANETVLIKEAGSGVAGITGGIHAFGVGSAGSFFTSFNGSKLRTLTTAGTNEASIATNPTSTLADFNGTNVTASIPFANVTFGLPNNSTNATYIYTLRGVNPGVATIVNPTAPFAGQNIFPQNTGSTTVQLTLDAQIPDTTLTDATITVPVAFGAPTGAVLSGPGAASGTASITGQVITVAGVEVTNVNSITVAISGLTTPVPTSSELGNYPFTVQANLSGGSPAPITGQPSARVIIPIEAIRDNDANGAPVDIGAVVAIEGICTEAQFFTTNTVAHLQNGTSSMTIFNSSATGNPFVRGRRYAILGSVGQFGGQTQVVVTSFANVIDLETAAEPAATEVTITDLLATPEAYEGRLVKLLNVSRDPADTDTWAANASITIQDTASPTPNTLPVYIANGSGAVTNPTGSFNITGIFSQFDTSSPFTEGYRFMPREEADIELIGGGSGYAAWIAGFYPNESDPLIVGPNADPDGDGHTNLVEAYTGSAPNAANGSPISGATKTGNTLVFTLQKAKTPVAGLSGAFQWSTGLGNWNASGATESGVTVSIAEAVSDTSNPAFDLYVVTATITAGSPDSLFVRLVVED